MESLIQRIKQAVVEGERGPTVVLVQQALESGEWPVDQILDEGLISAMDLVGERFSQGDFFIPEMMLSARAMQAALALLEPHIAPGSASSRGKVVIGTVKGDLHNIGKNLVAVMLKGAGYTVIDLGVDVKSADFVEAVRRKKPEIIALSALLTSTLPAMQGVIQDIEASGARQSVKIMVGGAPVTANYSRSIGADGYAADAVGAVKLAKGWTN